MANVKLFTLNLFISETRKCRLERCFQAWSPVPVDPLVNTWLNSGLEK